MAATKAKQEPAVKAERKKPVRTAPVQKDYPTKLEWLAALVEHETKQSEVSNAAKISRLDKRIASKKALRDKVVAELTALITERDKLAGVTNEDEVTEEGDSPESPA